MPDSSAMCDKFYLGDEDTPAYTRLGGSLAPGWLLICDHATNALPPEYGDLGLPLEQLLRHIAYDIGAEGVTRHMARLLACPAFMTRHSRLLIDCNRGDDDPTLIMRISDGAVVPGNRVLTAAERAKRRVLYYDPYHAAIDAVINRGLEAGRPPALVSIHSFTPIWRGQPRPWHVGILWDKDPRIAQPLLEALAREDNLIVGDNEPYSGELRGDCLWQHGTRRGLAHVLIEVRQDLIADEAGQRTWGERLARLLSHIHTTQADAMPINAVRHFGSRSDGP